jgi:hypothetical protein
MSFFHRLFAPEIVSLKAELAQVTAEREWFRGQCDVLGRLAQKRESDLKAEIKRNRLREDLLNNQIIELGGGRPLPPRIDIPVPNAQSDRLSQEEELLLRARAKEVLEQKHPGEDITAEMFEDALERMKEDPAYWLSN